MRQLNMQETTLVLSARNMRRAGGEAEEEAGREGLTEKGKKIVEPRGHVSCEKC